MIFWEVAVDKEAGNIRDVWNCPSCGVLLTKNPHKGSGALRIEHSWETHFDYELGQTVRELKQAIVLINYTVGKKRFEKAPDSEDIELLQKIHQTGIPYPIPLNALPKGDKTSDPMNSGITHAHNFHSRRNLYTLSAIWYRIREKKVSPLCSFLFTSTLPWTTKQNRLLMTNYFFKSGGVIAPNLPGTLYVSSVGIETNPLERFRLRIRSAPYTANKAGFSVSCQSSTQFPSFDRR